MEENNITILPINPNSFTLQEYSNSDQELIPSFVLDTVFDANTDYIELCVYDLNKNKIYPDSNSIPNQYNVTYSVREGDVLLNPEQDLNSLGLNLGVYNSIYNF